MTQNIQQAVLLSSEQYENGVTVSFYNISKKMAADRWLVRIRCEAVYTVPESEWAVLQEEDAGLVAGMKEKYSQGLEHTIVKERTFVDEAEMDEVLQLILAQLEENVCTYIGSDIFPQKLLDQKLEEWRQEYKVRKEMGMLEEPDDEDDGPADFSACFAD